MKDEGTRSVWVLRVWLGDEQVCNKHYHNRKWVAKLNLWAGIYILRAKVRKWKLEKIS